MKYLKFKISFLLTSFLFSISPILGNDYLVTSIPDSLKEDAVAVVREFSAVYTQSDVNNATYKVKKVVTVLNDRGKQFGHFVSYSDNFTDIRKFEGILRDATTGKEIKKIKKGDLIESSLSEQLATDYYSIYYELASPTYPYTIEYEYEQRFKNGIIAYPRFLPMEGMSESVELASYTIEIPLDFDLRYKYNFDCPIEESSTDKQKIYTFSATGVKALKSEQYAPAFIERCPMVKIAPNNFRYDGVEGKMSTWENYGLWVNKLLEGRDKLTPAMEAKVKELVAGKTDKKEIVKILYEYMQENSRYVNIALGIGGFQPMPAESVFKNRFGDCKGLSNVMKAMLNVVNIPSNYCEIYLGSSKTLDKDFFDMTQTNHAVLLVPLANDSIWLECTSQVIPFGYIHDDIEGHDALVITDRGGVMCQVPSYTTADNLTESTISLNISEDGKVDGYLKFAEHLHGFGSYHYMMKSNDRERHIKYLANSINFSKVNIGEIRTSEERSDKPVCTIEADFTATDVINKTGARIFIPLLPLKKSHLEVFKARTRNSDIVINNGYREQDSILINIPENYDVESLPKEINLITPYGVFIAKVEKKDETTLVYSQQVDIFRGRYDKSKYDEIKKFYQQMASASKRKIVVKKVES